MESSLGIKSYSELALYLPQGVQKVMAGLVNLNAGELIDEIVFRLYGLNKQEIGIVRGEN
jgi:hypothetical protein